MKIQFNSGKHISVSDELNQSLTSILSDELNRFKGQITRLEVHLSDIDGNKNGQDDKRCMLEARLEGLAPVAVTNNANTHEAAVKGAAKKLKASLDTVVGRLKNY